jgi:hypothetical protein
VYEQQLGTRRNSACGVSVWKMCAFESPLLSPLLLGDMHSASVCECVCVKLWAGWVPGREPRVGCLDCASCLASNLKDWHGLFVWCGLTTLPCF